MTDFGPVEETAQERAARLLVTPGALVQLSLGDAREVVRYLQPRRLPAGTVFIRAGESRHTGYLVLIIEGEVTVESPTVPGTDSLVVSVVGPGSLLGEMGLIDGSPRSATCTAATDLGVGLLTREALTQLIDDLPAVAARLLLAIAKRLSDHVRDANRKVLTMTQLNRALQQELDAAHSVNKRLLVPRG